MRHHESWLRLAGVTCWRAITLFICVRFRTESRRNGSWAEPLSGRLAEPHTPAGRGERLPLPFALAAASLREDGSYGRRPRSRARWGRLRNPGEPPPVSRPHERRFTARRPQLSYRPASPSQPSNPVLSLSKHAWSPRPPFDPRDKPEGRQAQGEVVIVLALNGHHESGLRLDGITVSAPSSRSRAGSPSRQARGARRQGGMSS